MSEPWWKNANQRVPSPQSMQPRPTPPQRRPTPMPSKQRPTPPARPPSHRRPLPAGRRRPHGQLILLIAVGVIAIGVAVVLVTVVLSSFDMFTGKALDVSKAEAGVSRILADPVEGYGATNVSHVVCNNGRNPKIKKGGTFTCTVMVDGRKRDVLVVFRDDNGTYEVDRPR